MNDRQPMRALLLVAHGSRRQASNVEVRELARRLDRSRQNPFALVSEAFLELAEPTIADGIERCIQTGATEVIVFPYFLSAGRHVAMDIPAEVRIKQDQHPEIRISLVEHLGAATSLPELILEHLRST